MLSRPSGDVRPQNAPGPAPDTAKTARLRVDKVSIGHIGSRDGKFKLACRDIALDVHDGEFIVLVGPSGCGKSTFLEAVAGLVPINRGALELDGKQITGPAPDRALVFQHASLYPWQTVQQNVAFGLQAQGRLDNAARERVNDLIDLVGLSEYRKKYPTELSGGMKQRANLARALATDPALLLLDEPFGALDAQTREKLQEELVTIWRSAGAGKQKTALFVTHDVREAVLLADRIVVFTPGPAQVKEIIPIGREGARDLEWQASAEFNAYVARALSALHGKDIPASDPDRSAR
jgi:NitT/TauT family transport system ATP-binding protein